tara:strand:- start:5259 stop:5567 length:309 start_codon:yes stop_codon:yes gene_type:complete
MLISPQQAIDLELKLNKSEYGMKWVELGDCFYNWRLNPKYNKIKGELFYKVTKKQMEWIKKNITTGVLAHKYYSLIETENESESVKIDKIEPFHLSKDILNS